MSFFEFFLDIITLFLLRLIMKLSYFLVRILLLLSVFCTSNVSAANLIRIIPDYSMSYYDQRIEMLYQKLAENPPPTTALRIKTISAYFFGEPYVNGALGEGKQALFDQEPLYRTDAFDCATYVSTVLALTEAHNLNEFKKIFLKVQYRDAKPTFLNRLHFTSVDWNVENAKNGYIRDITRTFKDAQGKPIFQIAEALINKPAWYEKKTAQDLSLLHPLSPEETQKRLDALRNLSKQVHAEKSQVAYIPLTALFHADGTPNTAIFRQIPSSSIIEIVRPNWDLEKMIGTHLNISHMGFAIRTPHGLFFREASSLEHRVMDTPLIPYLQQYLHNSTVKGINIHVIQ